MLKKRARAFVIIIVLCVLLLGCISRKDEEEKKIAFKELHTALTKHNMLIEKQNTILDKIYTLLKEKHDEEEAQKKRWGVK